MNYKRFKKATIWLALTCVLALPIAATLLLRSPRKGIIAVTTDGHGIITATNGGDELRIAPGRDPATIGTDMGIFPG